MAPIKIRIDDRVKLKAETLFNEISLRMSAAVTILHKAVGREKRAWCALSVDQFNSDDNIGYLEKIMHDVKEGEAHFLEHDLIEID